MQQRIPRGSVMRWLSPTLESSWTQLRVHLVVWSALTALWISWQFWGDGSTTRRLLMVLLAVLSIAQVLSTATLIRKKRERQSDQ